MPSYHSVVVILSLVTGVPLFNSLVWYEALNSGLNITSRCTDRLGVNHKRDRRTDVTDGLTTVANEVNDTVKCCVTGASTYYNQLWLWNQCVISTCSVGINLTWMFCLCEGWSVPVEGMISKVLGVNFSGRSFLRRCIGTCLSICCKWHSTLHLITAHYSLLEALSTLSTVHTSAKPNNVRLLIFIHTWQVAPPYYI